jgi:hypothetical protein
MAAEKIDAVSLDYFVGAKSTADHCHVLLKCRNANGEFHVAVRFDQVAPLISALQVELDARRSVAATPERPRKSRAKSRPNS